ncbi:MAG TPA: alpha/beta hydrolase [Micromonosporaceae bacterium]|nr:alpha/beta hydrolase [Micromonosporaceae bacterium]
MQLASIEHGDGFPLVCLPWFGLDGTVMAAAFEPALAQQPGLRRIYVDLPGCGRSPGGPADSDAVLDTVFDFIDQAIATDRFLLAGCSYGGYLAAAIARNRPGQVDGLLLVCPGVKIRPEDRELPDRPEESAEAVWLTEAPDDLRDHLAQALGNRTRHAAGQVGSALASSSPGDEAYLRRLWETGYRLSDEDSSAVYAGPTSIIAGRQDGIAGYADQFRALANYPQASYTVLADAGHYVPFEQPGAFRSLVLDWLARTSAAGTDRWQPA